MNEDVMKRLSKLEETVGNLQAELWVSQLPLEECDLEIRKDPKNATATYVGCKVSQVDDTEYLTELAKFYDWSAWKDSQAEGDSEDAQKKRKYAVYRRKDAAKVRRFISHKKTSGGMPF